MAALWGSRKYPYIAAGWMVPDGRGEPWMMPRGGVEEVAFAALPEDAEARCSTVELCLP
jgi:hypothetical protein